MTAQHHQTYGTVFFVDMRNFTLLTSKMIKNPREDQLVDNGMTQYDARLSFLVSEMSDFYRSWRSILRRHTDSGEIRRYLFQSTGDGVMIALEGDEHAEVAMDASLEMATGMRERLANVINPRIEYLGIRRRSDWLDFGVGICSGHFTYVELSRDELNPDLPTPHTILGTAPNYAARVEHANKDHENTRITIAQPTITALCEKRGINPSDHRLVEDTFGIRYVWKHTFAGMSGIGLYIRPFSD